MNKYKKANPARKLLKKFERIFEKRNFSDSNYNDLKELIDIAETSQNELENSLHALEERTKELTCLYELTRIIEMPGITSDELIKEVLELIPPAFQYPEITCVRITYGLKEYKTKYFNVTPWKLATGIYVRKKKKGKVEVYYLKKKSDSDEGPFLNEEKSLLFTIGRNIGHFIEQKETEKVLRSRQKRLVRAQQIARMGDFSWNVKTGSVYWSEAMFELLGYDKNEVFDYARINEEIHHPDDLKWVTNWLQKCLESEKTEHEPMEYRLIRKDGKIMHVQTHVSVNYENGKAVELFGTTQDITKRKEAETERLKIEEELKKQNQEYLVLNEEFKATNEELLSEKEKVEASEEKLRNLFSSIRDAIIVTDFNRKIVQVNSSFTTLFGYRQEEIIGKETSLLYEDINTYKETGQKIAENTNKPGLILNVTAKRKNGEFFPVEASFFNLENSDGELKGFVGILRDVTKEHKVRKELEQNEARLRVASENIEGILYAFDTNLNFTLSKGKKLSVFGLKPDELVGKSIFDFFKTDNPGHPMIQKHRKCLNGETINIETEENGVFFSTVISPLKTSAGEIIGVLGLATDITEIKQTEKKLKLTQFGIDNSKIGILRVENNGTISYANNHICKKLGYTAEELSGMSLFEIDDNFDEESFKRYREVGRIAGVKKIISSYKRKDGSDFPVEITANYMEFEGKIVSFAFIIDISERIKAEERLKASEEKYRTVFENTGTAACILEKDGTISLANAQFAELAGYTLDEIQNKKKWMEFVMKEDLESMRKQHELRRVNKEEALNEYNFRFVDRDKKIKYIHLVIDIIPGTHKSVASLIDITQQKEDAENIKERERQLSILMGNLPGMAYRCKNDKYWTMEFVSSGCKKLTGYGTDELKGNLKLSYGELIHEADWKMVWDAVQNTQLNDDSFVVEYRIRDKFKNLRWVWEQGKIVEKHIDGRGYIEGFIMDITERKMAEEELQRLKNDLQNQVEEKTSELRDRINELERFHEATIEREFRIKELRDELEKLKENQ